jgi:hypothetical protein
MLELLEKNPQATEVVKSYYLDVMLASLNDDSLPDNFKDFVRQQGIDNDKIAKIIDGSPRNLFDVFDENSLFIETMYMEGAFHYTINNGENVILSNPQPYKTRKECDRAVIEEAFKLLNDKLCPTLTES